MATKGLGRLKRQLSAIPRLQVEAASKAMQASAEDMVNGIKRAVPVDHGDLEASVGWTFGEAPDDATFKPAKAPSATASALGEAGLKVSVFEGNKNAIQARWVEFGTADAPAGTYKDANGKTRTNKQAHVGTRAQPHFYPTIRAKKKPAKRKMVSASNKAAKAVAAIR